MEKTIRESTLEYTGTKYKTLFCDITSTLQRTDSYIKVQY